MPDGSLGRGLGLDRGGGSRADPTRVDALRGSLDLDDGAAASAWGEDVRAQVAALLDRLAEAARGSDLEQSAAAIRRLRSRIENADPAMLQPRSGLAGVFDSRGKRLDGFREAFADVVRDLTETETDLTGRQAGLERRAATLDGLHADLSRLIAELDAWIAAGLDRLTEWAARPSADGDAVDRFAARLAQLGALREAAVARLPLIRVCQNTEGAAPGLNARACQALAGWRDDWSKALGLEGKKPRRVRPDGSALDQARGALIAALHKIETALEQAGERRTSAADRIARLSVSREG